MLDRDGLIAKLAPEWYAGWVNIEAEEQAGIAANLGIQFDPKEMWNDEFRLRLAGRVMARELNLVAGAAISELRVIDDENNRRSRGL